MKKRPVRTSVRMKVMRRRRIYTSFAETWERLRAEAARLGAANFADASAPSQARRA